MLPESAHCPRVLVSPILTRRVWYPLQGSANNTCGVLHATFSKQLSYNNSLSAVFTVAVFNTDSAGIQAQGANVVSGRYRLVESARTGVSFVLASKPTQPVIVSLAINGTDRMALEESSAVIAPERWNTPTTVYVLTQIYSAADALKVGSCLVVLQLPCGSAVALWFSSCLVLPRCLVLWHAVAAACSLTAFTKLRRVVVPAACATA